ncbi:MAG: flagellar basal body L-ring protein FlgH [Acidaminococcales bacterium]|jgi:flagellar L-ring protein precursor FlgH|nr:flagellar basal body L-ring protein FlgH [Acidaminococcales bacterium]
MKKTIALFALTSLLLARPVLCEAESLWQNNKKDNIYQDVKARNVGDILTIIISETSNATRSGTANNSKDASVNLSAGSGSLLGWLTAHGANTKDSFKTSGNITNANRLTANITVQVVGIQPNGNLLLSGTQSIKQNKDTQMITITGEVRPQDISSNNTILSNYVANSKIAVTGKGPIMRKQRQGILTQIMNFLF